MKIALCGNPNVGKTTLFNRLTRSDAPVGNWHGVTVEARSKRIKPNTVLTDLPGAYSLVARTPEERITCDGILFQDYDVFVYVAEVNNLRRNLYMLMQILEADKPAVLVVNMMDEAKGNVDLGLLSQRLGIPVVGASQKQVNPKRDILNAAEKSLESKARKLPYLQKTEVADRARKFISAANASGLPPEFLALKAMECDIELLKRVRADEQSDKSADADLPARLRYGHIDEILKGVAAEPTVGTRTKKIDGIVLGRFALPIFFAVMATVFIITFEVGRPLSELLVKLTALAARPVENSSLPAWAESLISDGIITGVGGVLAFLPQVVLLFLLTAVLQDSGYMSRVAFVTDDLFKKIGLSGRAAFSVVLGLGCSATAVLSARGIAGERARKRTAFITPFCPCSARLAVFTAIAAYFGLSGFFVAAMYVLGCASAICVLRVMKAFSKKDDGEDGAFIMEMPPYRIPHIKRVCKVVYSNVAGFVIRIGTVVLGVSVIMWILCNFSVAYGFTGGVEKSIMRTFADFIAPVFAPLGFGNWRAVAALVSGIAAKETVVSVIASLGGMSEVLGTPTVAASFTIFTCLYVPCVATVSALAKENGIKSAVLSVTVHTLVAYTASLVYYRSAMGYVANRTIFFAVWASIICAIAVAVAAYAVVRRCHLRSVNYGRK